MSLVGQSLPGRAGHQSGHVRCSAASGSKFIAFTGMPLAVGACVGRVVRLLPNGIAVKFVEKQTIRDLDRLVARTVPAAVKVAVTAEAPVAAMRAVMA